MNTNQKRGFTLVELLVVIVIIGLLATLITGAAVAARRAARNAKIRTEIAQIQMALESYKAEIGEYPPDLYDKKAVLRHVKKRWPRYADKLYYAGSGPYNSIKNNGHPTIDDAKYASFLEALDDYYTTNAGSGGILVNLGVPGMDGTKTYVDPAATAVSVSALTIWLGGLPDKNGKMAGFSADPTAPLGCWGTGTNPPANGTVTNPGGGVIVVINSTEKKEFLEMRIGENVSFMTSGTKMYPCLVNEIGSGEKVPYVYFRAAAGDEEMAYCYEVSSAPKIDEPRFIDLTSFNSEWGWVAPYARNCDPFRSTNPTPLQWYEPGRFQLIHPGLDGCFGKKDENYGPPLVAVPSNGTIRAYFFRSINSADPNNTIKSADNDNITNFSQSTFEGLIP